MKLDSYLEETGERAEDFAGRVRISVATCYRIMANTTWPSRDVWRRIREATDGRVLPSDHIEPARIQGDASDG